MGISQQKEQQQDGTGSAFFDNLDEKIVSTKLVGLRVSKVICVGFAPELEFRKLIGYQLQLRRTIRRSRHFFNPIRSKTKTSCDLLGHVFEFLFAHWVVDVLCDWLERKYSIESFDLTMLNLKSGWTCFWIVLVKKCTYSAFFRNIWWTHCQEGIINHLRCCLVLVSCIYTWIEDEPWREKRESRINCIETCAQNELIGQMSGCDVDACEEFSITLSPERTPSHYPC